MTFICETCRTDRLAQEDEFVKQAVVVIHGIGEQRPMDTLRAFADAVLPDVEPGKEKFWSKPDKLSDLFELRVLQSTSRNRTDFFEYYWAHHVKGTRASHLISWGIELLWCPKKTVPRQLLALWTLGWVLTTAFVAFAFVGMGSFAAPFRANSGAQPFSAYWLIGAAISAVIQFFVLQYVGDAARYLSPSPKNVAIRQKIRAEGVKLLRTLHERGYDRIVVVGHSLGSVIGYDIITTLWHEYHKDLDKLAGADAELVRRFTDGEALQPTVSGELPSAGSDLTDVFIYEKLQRFRDAQHDAFLEQKRLGNPWRISDFITLGSPLSHAPFLLARSPADFDRYKRQKELPTCPPILDEKGYAFAQRAPIQLGQRKFTPLVLHHAAPFAVTSWTNIFFRARYGLFGDFVGGPLAKLFGFGLLDVEIIGNKDFGILGYTPLVHTRYWSKRAIALRQRTRANFPLGQGEVETSFRSVNELRTALRLARLRKYIDRS